MEILCNVGMFALDMLLATAFTGIAIGLATVIYRVRIGLGAKPIED